VRRAIGASAAALLFSFGLQGAIVVLGSLFGGHFGAPFPDGQSRGIGADLLGGFLSFSLLLFLADVLMTALPLMVLARPLRALSRPALLGLALLAGLMAGGPLLLVMLGARPNWTVVALGAVIAATAAWLTNAVARRT
jgi:hypothetical protein